MKIKVNLFSSVRTVCGFKEEDIILPDDYTVGMVLSDLAGRYPGLKSIENLLIAVNEEYCNEDELLCDGDILALFPPVSGG